MMNEQGNKVNYMSLGVFAVNSSQPDVMKAVWLMGMNLACSGLKVMLRGVGQSDADYSFVVILES